MYLIPGDSPMGYRLPLDSLPWAALATRDSTEEPDPVRSARSAAEIPGAARRAASVPTAEPARTPWPIFNSGDSPPRAASRADARAWRVDAGIVRTALCTEARNGVLYVFMPPVPALEDYLELVAAVEATAAASGHAGRASRAIRRRPIQRLASFTVTPDPGVIEVNIQPATNLGRARREHDDAALRRGARSRG